MYDDDVMSAIFESIGMGIDNTIPDEEFEFSANFINEFCDQLYNKQLLLVEDFDMLLEAATNNIESKANKMGITKEVTNKIGKEVKSTCKDVVDTIKKDGITKESRNSISHKFKKLHDNINNALSSEDSWWLLGPVAAKLEKAGCTEKAKITKAFSVLLWVIIINSIANLVLTLLMGPVGNMITGCIVAPIVEENAKQQAIKGGFTKEFSILFNLFEFSEYVIKYGPLFGFAKMVITRLAVVGFHLTTTFVQWAFQNEKVLKALKIDPNDEAKKEKLGFIGNVIGIVMHSVWNFTAYLSAI